MSRNASGTYTLPAGNPVVSGTTISSTWANDTLDDIATEMTASLDRNGKGGMLAALRGVDGTVSAPAYAWTSETNSGLYRISAGTIGFAIGGTNVLTIDANGLDLGGTIKADDIVEKTTDHGVEIETVLLKDGEISVDTINEYTTDNGVAIDGITVIDGQVTSPRTYVSLRDTTNGSYRCDRDKIAASTDRIGSLVSRARYDSTNYSDGCEIVAIATQTWSGSQHGTALELQTCSNGTTSLATQLKIDGNGDVIITNDLEVDTINEKSAGSGVTIDGLLIKDGAITGYEPSDATILKEADVDDTPVNGATVAPVSSNWAFDHAAAADPHSAANYTKTNAAETITSDWTFSGKVTLNGEVDEKVYTSSSTSLPLDPGNGVIQHLTPATAPEYTDSIAEGEYVTLMLDVANTVTWPTIQWAGGSAPTLDTTNMNIIELWKVGSTLYGAYVGAAS